MAGTYADVPDNRMLLDRDGTGIFSMLGATKTALDAAAVRALNDESSSGLGVQSSADATAYLVAFPELRDVAGLYLCFVPQVLGNLVSVVVTASSDTTTGVDGTWHTVFASSQVYTGTAYGIWGKAHASAYRDSIQIASLATGIRCLKIEVTADPGTEWELTSIHAYGKISAGVTIDRIVFWHPTENRRISGSHFDWADVPPGSAADVKFRVKNLSSDKIAGGIVVDTDVLTDASPSVPPQHYFAYAGGSFAGTCAVPPLNPLGVSGVVTMRRVTPSAAAAGLWAIRVVADVATWTEAGA